jgi:hypothetical protein
VSNEVAKQLAPIQQIGATPAALLVTGGSKRDIVTSIHMLNTSAYSVTVTLYRVPSGHSVVTATKIYAVVLGAQEAWQWEGLRVLTAADAIYGEATAAAVVNIEIDGVEEDV